MNGTAASRTIPLAFWLLPAQADAARLAEIVRRLAAQHDGPLFDPHLTLHVAECAADADIEAALDQAARQAAPFTLAARHTGHSPAYYKALFVEIAGDRLDGPRLPALRRQLVDAMPLVDAERSLAAYEFLPHLSLLYGQLPQSLRQQLAIRHDLDGSRIVFDRVAAVRPAAGHADLAQVDRWDVFGHRRLRG